MTSEVYKGLLKFPKLLGEHRYKIVKLLLENNEMNISEIQRGLGISYKETRRHVYNLEEIGIVVLRKIKGVHQPCLCSLKDI